MSDKRLRTGGLADSGLTETNGLAQTAALGAFARAPRRQTLHSGGAAKMMNAPPWGLRSV